jgi:UDP-N-acetylmuramyl pentapeptide phosphotransferase/UDP-N-acetylglucosamine-1-phosphate transferase
LPEIWLPALAAGLATLALTRLVLGWLHHRQILDHPNERSSHSLPTPRGGGLATTPVMVMVLLVLALSWGFAGGLALGALVLLGISWLDDHRPGGLPALPRFAAQGLMVALVLTVQERPVLGEFLPLWLDHLLAGLGWLWFVNLYNFMDGIDGITGSETASLGLGIALVAGLTTADPLIPAALAVAAIGAAFLVFNWHPAKLFLGDSGSVPFGFVLGGLLIQLAMDGHLLAALILPLYYVADATITISKRALRGEKIWQAHRQHFYQRAVQGGKRHDQVVLAVLVGKLVLMGAAALAVTGMASLALQLAVAATAILLAVLHHWSKGATP